MFGWKETPQFRVRMVVDQMFGRVDSRKEIMWALPRNLRLFCHKCLFLQQPCEYLQGLAQFVAGSNSGRMCYQQYLQSGKIAFCNVASGQTTGSIAFSKGL